MVCIKCDSKTEIINSRPQKRTNSNWRRRQCKNCHQIFTTIETIDYQASWRVAKRSGALEPFLPDKLFLSLLSALKPKATAVVDARALCDTVIAKLSGLAGGVLLSSQVILEQTANTLKTFNTPAYVRYVTYKNSGSSIRDLKRSL